MQGGKHGDIPLSAIQHLARIAPGDLVVNDSQDVEPFRAPDEPVGCFATVAIQVAGSQNYGITLVHKFFARENSGKGHESPNRSGKLESRS
jgi:hypothetical protein